MILLPPRPTLTDPPFPYSTFFRSKGETIASFLSSDELFAERPIGGRAYDERFVDGLGEFVYLARIEHDGAIGGEDRLKAGVSALYGPNSTGREDRKSTRLHSSN